jgi:peptidoglycan/LPS O-acetylase OafA/YrhL
MLKDRNRRLDIIRGLSILLVVSYHFSQNYFNYAKIEANLNDNIALKNIIMYCTVGRFGYYGVYLFFMLSGYLIHSIYFRSNIKPFSFYKKRILRIYPLYLVTLTMFFLVFHKYENVNMKDYLFHFFFIHNFDQETYYSINPSFWSLAIEVQFYLFFPIINFFSHKKHLIFYLFIASLFFSGYIIYNSELNNNNIMTTPKYVSIWLIGWVISEYKTNLDFFYSKFKLLINCIFIFLVTFAFSNLSSKINLDWLNFLLSNLFFVFLFYKLLTMKISFFPMMLKKYVGNILVFYGMISYALYVIHQPIIATVKSFFNNSFENSTLNMIFESSCSIFIFTLLAYSTHKLIENKLRTYLFS